MSNNIDPQQRNSPKKMEPEEEDYLYLQRSISYLHCRHNNVPPLSSPNTDEPYRPNREHAYTTSQPGYGFVPAREELIRVSNLPLPLNWIQELNISNFHPQKPTSIYKSHRGKESSGKYPNGKQPLQSPENGFWKANGADVVIHDDQGIEIGTTKNTTLVCYEGRVAEKKNKSKTDWIMHEYRKEVDNGNSISPVIKNDSNGMMLDEWISCNKTYKDDVEENEIRQLENNTMIVPAVNNQQHPNGDNFSVQLNDAGANPSTNDPNLHNTARLFMKNVQVSNPNTNQGSYVVHFDTLDNLKGQEDDADFDKMVSTPMSDYDPNFRCWGNGCVYTQSFSNEVTQVLDQLPIFQAMVRDCTLAVQNVQEQIPNSPNAWFSCFCFAYVS